MEEVDRLRREVPGFKDAHLCHIADQIGITESRRLVGEYILGRDDVDKPCDDVITITGHWTKYEALYYNYRSLLPKNFLTSWWGALFLWIIGASCDKEILRAWRQVKLLTAAALAVRDEWSRIVDVKTLQKLWQNAERFCSCRAGTACRFLWRAEPALRPDSSQKKVLRGEQRRRISWRTLRIFAQRI
jgi:hypothetical protein